ncbi:MAG: hypothetical protein WKG00_01460 [Polyangiaceae bacterium]
MRTGGRSARPLAARAELVPSAAVIPRPARLLARRRGLGELAVAMRG